MSEVLNDIERISSEGCIRGEKAIISACRKMYDEPLALMKTAYKEHTALRYAIAAIAKGYGYNRERVIRNLNYSEFAFLVLSTPEYKEFHTLIKECEIDKVVYGRMLGMHFVQGLIESYETNRKIQAFFAINFKEYIQICEEYDVLNRMRQKIERFYRRYDALNLQKITDNTTIGTILRDICWISKRPYIPGVFDLDEYGTQVEIANSLAVFVAFECMDAVFEIFTIDKYADIEAKYDLFDINVEGDT